MLVYAAMKNDTYTNAYFKLNYMFLLIHLFLFSVTNF